jgi:hypothetical protein
MIIRIGLMATILTLTGCGLIEKQAREEESDTSTAGARLLETNYEQLDLVALLDPEGRAKQKHVALTGNAPLWEDLPEGKRIDLALDAYHAKETADKVPETDRKQHRDQIQERLLGASNEMCYRYKRYLQNLRSDANFWLGTLTTIAGAAGAIASGGASQALAGAASALSGVRAEFNQEYFHNVTVATIWKGIEYRRQRAFDTIARQGQAKDTTVYPVEAAVKDAINYHAECSLVAGVEELGDTVQMAKDPGLDAVSRTLMKLNIARKIAESKSTDPADLLGDAAPGSPSASLLEFGTPRGNAAGAGGEPMAALGGFLQSVQKVSQESKKIVSEMPHWPEVTTPTRTSLNAQIDERAAKTALQLTNCQSAASATSIEIATAEGAAAVASTPIDRAKTSGDLAIKKAQGEAIVNKMVVTLESLKDDLEASIGALNRTSLSLTKPDQKIPEADLTRAAKALTDSTTQADANLACTPPQ